MKKRLLLILFSIFFCFCLALGFSACDFFRKETDASFDPQYDTRFTYEKMENGLHWRITGLNVDESVTEITIPDYYDYRAVVEIAPSAFYENKHLKKVVIGDRVNEIQDFAFYGCTALEEVVFNRSLLFIRSSSFMDCPSLKKVDFTQSESLINILPSAFENCPIEELTLPSNIKKVSANAFKNTKIKKIHLPNSLKKVEHDAFNTETLKETHIDDILFFCTKEFETPTANPTYFTKNLFLNGEEIKHLVIPETVTVIYPHVFHSLTFESIHIGRRVREISPMAFAYTTKLGAITVEEDNETYRAENNCLVYYILENSRHVVFASNQTTTIPEGMVYISAYAFYNNPNLEEIIIPEGVTEICGYAFANCKNLKSVQLPSTLTDIQYNAFSGCSALTTLTLPELVQDIGEYAFFGCSSIKELTIDCLYTVELGTAAFANCFNLETVVFVGVYELPNMLFMNCKKLRSFTAENTWRIHHAAFLGCESLQTADFQIYLENYYLQLYKTNNDYLLACVTSNKNILYYD